MRSIDIFTQPIAWIPRCRTHAEAIGSMMSLAITLQEFDEEKPMLADMLNENKENN